MAETLSVPPYGQPGLRKALSGKTEKMGKQDITANVLLPILWVNGPIEGNSKNTQLDVFNED